MLELAVEGPVSILEIRLEVVFNTRSLFQAILITCMKILYK